MCDKDPRVVEARQLREATPSGVPLRYRIRDNDGQDVVRFDQAAQTSGILVLRTPYHAPRAKATWERFLGSVRRAYTAYFNRMRPHQGLGQRVPHPAAPRNVGA